MGDCSYFSNHVIKSCDSFCWFPKFFFGKRRLKSTWMEFMMLWETKSRAFSKNLCNFYSLDRAGAIC
ncbi:hypothetical protein quinque_006151 [Culex quinquefasciatus]